MNWCSWSYLSIYVYFQLEEEQVNNETETSNKQESEHTESSSQQEDTMVSPNFDKISNSHISM